MTSTHSGLGRAGHDSSRCAEKQRLQSTGGRQGVHTPLLIFLTLPDLTFPGAASSPTLSLLFFLPQVTAPCLKPRSLERTCCARGHPTMGWVLSVVPKRRTTPGPPCWSSRLLLVRGTMYSVGVPQSRRCPVVSTPLGTVFIGSLFAGSLHLPPP